MTEKRKFAIYTNGIIDKRIYDGDEIPEGFHRGRHYKFTPWNKGLTKDDPRVAKNTELSTKTRNDRGYTPWNKGLTKADPRVAKNYENMLSTIRQKYGVDNIIYHTVASEDYIPWNKGLTKDTDERMKKASDNHKGVTAWNAGKKIPGHAKSDEAKQKIREAHLSTDFKERRYASMKERGTLWAKDSKPEHNFYLHLVETYGEDNVKRQYFDKERYPFKCDFYIVSEDKFIEYHGTWTHGGHPFDSTDESDIAKLNEWMEKSKTSKYYKNAIYTWTDLDVRKLETAKKNNLNFEVIYN